MPHPHPRSIHRHALLASTAVMSALLVPSITSAETKASLKDQLAEFTTDLSMPATPAAVHVGLSGESVLTPKNRREFEAAIPNLINEAGKPAGAIEFAPYYVFRGGKLKFQDYRTDNLLRSATKTTIGLAGGDREIDGAKVSARGYSITTMVVDLGDPIYSHSLKTCIDDVQAGMRARHKNDASSSEEPLLGAAKRAALTAEDQLVDPQSLVDYKACISAREPQLWNRTRVSLGVASGTGRERAGAQRKVDYGTAYWISAQYGFEDWATLVRTIRDAGYYDCVEERGEACARRREPGRWEQVASLTAHIRHTRGFSSLDLTQTGDLPSLSSTLYGVRFTYGSQKRALFAEVSRLDTKVPAETNRRDQHALGASFRVLDNLWVTFVTGRRKQFVNDKLDSVVDLSLQYGLAREPLVATR